MKAVIYGKESRTITKLEELVEELAIRLMGDDPVHETTPINSSNSSLSIRDLLGPDDVKEENKYKLAIFAGIAPQHEIEIALNAGMRVLVLLAPVEFILNSDVILGKTKSLDDKEALSNDLFTVLKTAA